jgi:hypothetical protein
MEENRILDSIRKEKLQLDYFEKFIYFKVSLLCFFISIISFIQGFQSFSNFKSNEVTTKVGLIFLVLSMVSFVVKLLRLKLIRVEFTIPNATESILNLAKERNWEIELKKEKLIILNRIPIKGYDDYITYNRNEGEKIYVFFNGKQVLLRSIDNIDNFAFKIQNGENSANEKAILNRIKPAGNSHYNGFGHLA